MEDDVLPWRGCYPCLQVWLQLPFLAFVLKLRNVILILDFHTKKLDHDKKKEVTVSLYFNSKSFFLFLAPVQYLVDKFIGHCLTPLDPWFLLPGLIVGEAGPGPAAAVLVGVWGMAGACPP